MRKELGTRDFPVELILDASIGKKFRQTMYDITDKGPNFMRSAVKTSRLLRL